MNTSEPIYLIKINGLKDVYCSLADIPTSLNTTLKFSIFKFYDGKTTRCRNKELNQLFLDNNIDLKLKTKVYSRIKKK